MVMGAVLVNTCRKSKLPYLFLTAGMFTASSFFGVLNYVLTNWANFCYPLAHIGKKHPNYNSKCPEISGPLDFTFWNKVSFAISSAN